MPHIDLGAPSRAKRPLHLELIPSSAWYKNVRTEFSKEHWDILRKWTYMQAEYYCEICGGKGSEWPVECHEMWEWDEKKQIQRLKGFIALCPDCHSVKHMGHTAHLGKKQYTQAYKHMMKVNDWSHDDVEKHYRRVSAAYERRSAMHWTLDITYAKALLVKITGGKL